MLRILALLSVTLLAAMAWRPRAVPEMPLPQGVHDTAAPTPPPPPPGHVTRRTALSMELAAHARAFLDRPPRGFRDDCSGFVEGVMTASGVPVYGSVKDLWERAEAMGATHHDPIPHIGDLVFFDNTWDRNKNGREDDPKTHIAIVLDVDPDGTVWMAHRGSRHAVIRMNLLDPFTHEDGGQVRNSHLRRTYRSPRGWPLHLTAELWSGYATIPPGSNWGGRPH